MIKMIFGRDIKEIRVKSRKEDFLFQIQILI